eukprot:jgi/Botrbrau1/13521/Bobra.0347s0007.1
MSLGRALRGNRSFHLLIATVVGVTSGIYIFNPPLKRYWDAKPKTDERTQKGQ